MSHKRILLIQGHPDPQGGHYGHALADAYRDGAKTAGHEVRVLQVACIDFPLLRSKGDWDQGTVPDSLTSAQRDIIWAEHIVLFFPLWLGGMPAVLKGFLEQVARPGFALDPGTSTSLPKKLLAGRSARIVVTMGMPALIFKWYFRAHSIKALERNILGMIGVAPVNETLIGSVESMEAGEREAWIKKLGKSGSRAQ